MRGGPASRTARFVSASELAEYVYCPRAHYYRLQPEGRPVAPGALARERSGVEYHTRRTSADRRWAEASPLPWVGALLAGIVLLGVVVLGWVP